MRKHVWVLLSVVGLLAAAAGAQVPPLVFSTDLQGPLSIPSGGPLSGGDILIPTPPAPGPGPLPIPTVAIPEAALGIVAGMSIAAEVDAISWGFNRRNREIFFSVDEFASGVPGTPLPPAVWTEGALGGVGAMEASADVFMFLGPPVGPIPPGPIMGNTAIYDGNGFAPSGLPGLGFIEPNPPTPGLTPDPGDNLDGLEMAVPLHPFPVYFSMDSAFPDPLELGGYNTGTAILNGFVGGDVVVTLAPGAPPVLYAPAAALGLDMFGPDTDDLDALILFEDGDEVFTPADFLLFSVRRGSAIIGMPDSIFGAPIEEGDILIPTGPGMPPGIWIAAEALGLATVRSGMALQFGDDLDALATVPEPVTLTLLGIGGLALLRRRR